MKTFIAGLKNPDKLIEDALELKAKLSAVSNKILEENLPKYIACPVEEVMRKPDERSEVRRYIIVPFNNGDIDVLIKLPNGVVEILGAYEKEIVVLQAILEHNEKCK